MRLTMFSDYALRILILAAGNGARNVTVEEAATRYGISAPHLKKVVRLLTREGFLEAQRGRSGGFRLARRPAEINLGRVIRVTEPDFGLVECFRPENRCVISRSCRLPPIVNRALQAMLEVFDGHTLADVIVDDPLLGDFRVSSVGGRQPQRGPRIGSGKGTVAGRRAPGRPST